MTPQSQIVSDGRCRRGRLSVGSGSGSRSCSGILLTQRSCLSSGSTETTVSARCCTGLGPGYGLERLKIAASGRAVKSHTGNLLDSVRKRARTRKLSPGVVGTSRQERPKNNRSFGRGSSRVLRGGPDAFSRMVTNVRAALWATLFTWFTTALGASMVFILPADGGMRQKRLLDGLLAFAAGVMTAASFW